MRILFIVGASIALLSGCTPADASVPEEVAACEAFTAALIENPSSFERVEFTSWADKLEGIEPEQIRIIAPEIGDRKPGSITVQVEYNEVLADGRHRRAGNSCWFPTANGKILEGEVAGLNKSAEEILKLRFGSGGEEVMEMGTPVRDTT